MAPAERRVQLARMPEPRLLERGSTAESSLNRVFSLIAFDWDGTALSHRAADAARLGAAMDRLLRAGAWLCVLTGTRFAHVDGALAGHLRGPHVARLLVATNRGSELYGYDASAEPVLLHRRVATPAENAALDRIAEVVASELTHATGLDVGVVRDRLNRRKLDLFPSWSDPPKARIGELVEAVEARLAASGWRGGLGAVVRRVLAVAEACGLPSARVTSDGKHVEVGLTDKADAIDAMFRWTNEPAAGALLVGDEVGTVGGVCGSDARMATARTHGAVFASVGPEPEGRIAIPTDNGRHQLGHDHLGVSRQPPEHGPERIAQPQAPDEDPRGLRFRQPLAGQLAEPFLGMVLSGRHQFDPADPNDPVGVVRQERHRPAVGGHGAVKERRLLHGVWGGCPLLGRVALRGVVCLAFGGPGRSANSSSFFWRGSRLIAASRFSAVLWVKPISSWTTLTGRRLLV